MTPIITSVQLSMNIGHLVDIGVESFPNMILIESQYALVWPKRVGQFLQCSEVYGTCQS